MEHLVDIILRPVIRIFLAPLFLLGRLLPKDEKIWIFGSGNGEHFSDNSKALFEYVSNRHSSISAVWLTKDRTILDLIRGRGFNAHMFYSFRGICLALTAKILIISNSFLDLSLTSYLFSKNSLIIQLWHGTPFKRLENMTWSPGKLALMNLFLDHVGRDCDVLVSSAKINEEIYVRNFRVQPQQIACLGQPRNDKLFQSRIEKKKGRHVWYMPTFREFDKDFDFFRTYGFDQNALEQLLEEHDAYFVINFHNIDKKRYRSLRGSFLTESTRVRLYNGEDIYEELSSADVLITDYSSVFLDYLLLNRPIIFAPFDLEKYSSSRGFYYPYDEVTPGPKLMNWPTILIELDRILRGEDSYAPARIKIRDMFNDHIDSRSSERCAVLLESLLSHKVSV